jgi:cold shock CspA family protein
MIGVVKKLNKGFGFIAEESTGKFWYFKFSDTTNPQMLQEGLRARFERKHDEQKFKEDLNKGLLKDKLTNHRNPALRKTIRDSGVPKAPAAHKVEMLVGREP